jgi:RNA-binding protein
MPERSGGGDGIGSAVVTRAKRNKQPLKPVELTGKQRSHLRALAHSQKPVVQIGQAGLTPNVIKQIDESLQAHELIKIRVSREAPIDAASAATSILTKTRAALAQIVGRVAVLYRPHPTEPRIQLPTKKARARAAKAKSTNGAE